MVVINVKIITPQPSQYDTQSLQLFGLTVFRLASPFKTSTHD